MTQQQQMRTLLVETELPWLDNLETRRAKRPQKLGVYAGSFDPLTIGHMWMIEQGVGLFDRLVVAIGINPDKQSTFTVEERLAMLRDSTRQFSNLTVVSFSNIYLSHYAESIGATHILRGIRSATDYEYERAMRNINGDMHAGICTVFLMPPRPIVEVSSSMVKGLIGPVGWPNIIQRYVPKPVYQKLLEHHAATLVVQPLSPPDLTHVNLVSQPACTATGHS